MKGKSEFKLSYMAQVVLYLLVVIHWLLPFTPVNQHPEPHIKIAALGIGAIFLMFAQLSYSRPRQSFAGGLIFLLILYIVSAVTGASPITEGLVVKLLFAALLLVDFLDTGKASEKNSRGEQSFPQRLITEQHRRA
ncbi:hypothetical protein [Thalassomonas actiniarum]|uniref:Uncharacterized protein n=1 Tax=Thalassomonas actiniarum TaxID=485447 RepID=A0AAE9YW78_9GAMM|nr:hypothetical protein [Thalassomonas actiniarum]WDE01505.1 hypothetical protein SG35_013330 [Thalassomonas actiniarum]